MKITKKELLKFTMISAVVKKFPAVREKVLLDGNANLESRGKVYRLGLSDKNTLCIVYNDEIRLDFGGKLKNWNEKIKDIPD